MNFSTENNPPQRSNAQSSGENDLNISSQGTAEQEEPYSEGFSGEGSEAESEEDSEEDSEDYTDCSDNDGSDGYDDPDSYDGTNDLLITNAVPCSEQETEFTTDRVPDLYRFAAEAQRNNFQGYMPEGIYVSTHCGNNRFTYMTPFFDSLQFDEESKIKMMAHIICETKNLFRLFRVLVGEFGELYKQIRNTRKELRAISRRSNYLKVQIGMCRWIPGMCGTRQRRLLSRFTYKLNETQFLCKYNYITAKETIKSARLCTQRLQKLAKRATLLNMEMGNLRTGITEASQLHAKVQLAGMAGDYDRATIYVPRIAANTLFVRKNITNFGNRINKISSCLYRTIKGSSRTGQAATNR